MSAISKLPAYTILSPRVIVMRRLGKNPALIIRRAYRQISVRHSDVAAEGIELVIATVGLDPAASWVGCSYDPAMAVHGAMKQATNPMTNRM